MPASTVARSLIARPLAIARTGFAVAATALSVVVTATPSAAQRTNDPITINSCAPLIANTQGGSLANLLAAKSNGIGIEFTNESAKTADLVNFAVDSNGQRFVIRDVGTFSPGVSIKHTYRNGSGQAFVLPAFIAPSIRCHVASVKFSDGTLWRRKRSKAGVPTGAASLTPASGHAAALSANPAHVTIDAAADSQLFMIASSEPVTAFKESDDCAGIASIFVAATGQSSAAYSVKPVAAGSCAASVTDEAGNRIMVPVTVH